MGVDALGSSLGNFADNMNPSLLDSLKGGMAALFGQDSPVEQLLALSKNADPVKIMDLAKATMATTAANSGATSLDPSLSSGGTTTITNNDGTTTTTTNVAPASNDDLLEALGVMSAQNVTQSEIMRKTNKLLTEISGKT
jgi:hypothetical protein